MNTFQEWLEERYKDWEKTQGGKQNYYTFARFLNVGHSSLTLWIAGAATPAGDDLAKLASKLGPEIYGLLKLVKPNSPLRMLTDNFNLLPAAFQARLANAVTQTAQNIAQNKLDPESADAKRLAVHIFEKWGFKISG